MKYKTDKCEAIIWRDAFHPYHGGWLDEAGIDEFIKDTDYLCCNVGWVIHEDKKMVTIAGMASKQDSLSHIQRIPIGCIVKRVRIKNPW